MTSMALAHTIPARLRHGLSTEQLGLHQPFGYWSRRKAAVALIFTVQLPWLLVAATRSPETALVLGLATVVWMWAMVRSRALRGWSVRLPAEAVADLLRIFGPVALGVTAWLMVLGRNWQGPLAAQATTLVVLIGQALFWRGRPASWVRIVGSPSTLGAAVGTFEQCLDLLGHDGCRYAPFRADRPEPDAWARRMRAWLARGETVLVLEPRLQDLARSLKPAGDVIVSDDCLLFTSMARPAGRVTDAVLGVLNQCLALTALLTLWPIGLLIAVLIRLDDGGPVWFTQKRVGKDGRIFMLYKFRTMRPDADRYAVHPNGDDPRITRIGRILRKLSLDELPQILNVLKGDMRLVGPRPEMPFIVERYGERERARLAVAPGITGLWQVSPHRNDPIHEHLEYDLAYIAHRGPILDLALIIATAGLANSSGN